MDHNLTLVKTPLEPKPQLIHTPCNILHCGIGQQRKDGQDQGASETEGREHEQIAEEKAGEDKGCDHGAPYQPSLDIEGGTYLK